MMTYKRMVAGPAIAACLAVTAAAQHPKFFPDDPVRIDDDQLDVAARPADIELSDLFDRFGNIFVDLGAKEPTEAQHVNTLDEVPDSAWFTNRHGAERLSLARSSAAQPRSSEQSCSMPSAITRRRTTSSRSIRKPGSPSSRAR